MVKSEALINEASLVIVDISGDNDVIKWELVSVRNMQKQLILIAEEGQSYHGLDSMADHLCLTYDLYGDNQAFVSSLENALERMEALSVEQIGSEPSRLLQKKEYTIPKILLISIYSIMFRTDIIAYFLHFINTFNYILTKKDHYKM